MKLSKYTKHIINNFTFEKNDDVIERNSWIYAKTYVDEINKNIVKVVTIKNCLNDNFFWVDACSAHYYIHRVAILTPYGKYSINCFSEKQIKKSINMIINVFEKAKRLHKDDLNLQNHLLKNLAPKIDKLERKNWNMATKIYNVDIFF